MSSLEDFEEIDVGEAPPKKKRKPRKGVQPPKQLNSSRSEWERLLATSPTPASTSLFGESKKKPPLSSRVKQAALTEKLYFQQQLAENRKNFLRGQNEFKMMEECTFSPQINSPSSKKRSIKHFLDDQTAYEIDKKTRLFSSKQSKKTPDLPQTLSPGSIKIISSRKVNSPVHERLYTAARQIKPPKRSCKGPHLSPKSTSNSYNKGLPSSKSSSYNVLPKPKSPE